MLSSTRCAITSRCWAGEVCAGWSNSKALDVLHVTGCAEHFTIVRELVRSKKRWSAASYSLITLVVKSEILNNDSAFSHQIIHGSVPICYFQKSHSDRGLVPDQVLFHRLSLTSARRGLWHCHLFFPPLHTPQATLPSRPVPPQEPHDDISSAVSKIGQEDDCVVARTVAAQKALLNSLDVDEEGKIISCWRGSSLYGAGGQGLTPVT